MRRQIGFTLIEVMIVVAILAILAGIALPLYSDYVTRGRLSEAHAILANGRVAAEQYFQDNRTYVGMPCPGNTSNFNFACVTAAGAYTITATGTGGAAGFAFTINQANVRATTAVPATGGWATNATCWIVRKGGGCA
ncbi:MAG: type IV pilin protein [Pseudomonadota bacterium]